MTKLSRWNKLPDEEAESEILPCCGSRSWSRIMAGMRPIDDEKVLLAISGATWKSLKSSDWDEAFRSHPRIGETPESARSSGANARSAGWSAQEQRNVTSAGDDLKLELAEGNREYEKRFGRIFIVCATGKSPAEILEILRRRLHNEDAAELQEAGEQQRQIIQVRLRKWLAS
jgi:2-oxo-4-hydroxy-4-carboxy-5-ureidoimidazoline decarboxylase